MQKSEFTESKKKARQVKCKFKIMLIIFYEIKGIVH
jgi:hypothetical protein